VLKLPHEVLRPGSQDEVLVVGAGGLLDVRHVVLAVDKDGSLLVRRGLDATDKLVSKPKPEAKAGDVVSVDAPGAKP
jgi:hypothetical protein